MKKSKQRLGWTQIINFLNKNRVIIVKVILQKQSPRGVLLKNVFLEVSQNSQENTCARVVFLIKLQVGAMKLCLKRDFGTGGFL